MATCTRISQEELEQVLDAFTAACRAAGLKVTHQRTEIYRHLVTLPDHPSAETLYKRLLPTLPTISLDTVYRTLTTLEQHGLVSRIQTAESQARFEAVFTHHHHLICSHCKRVYDFTWPEVDAVTLPEELVKWGKIDSKTIVMYGICNTCTDQ